MCLHSETYQTSNMWVLFTPDSRQKFNYHHSNAQGYFLPSKPHQRKRTTTKNNNTREYRWNNSTRQSFASQLCTLFGQYSINVHHTISRTFFLLSTGTRIASKFFFNRGRGLRDFGARIALDRFAKAIWNWSDSFFEISEKLHIVHLQT